MLSKQLILDDNNAKRFGDDLLGVAISFTVLPIIAIGKVLWANAFRLYPYFGS